jgi:chaperonin GroEL
MPPQFGYKQHELMQDIALSVGAKYFSEKTGDDLSLLNMNDLGHADKIISGKSQTVIIKNNQMTEEIEKRISDLKEQQENTEIVSDREFINERIASLSGSIGAIYVGGNSDIEQKEKYDRVEDAVCAVRSALQEGIVKGGGLALFYARQDLDCISKKTVNDDESTAIDILMESLCAPLKQILQNAGLNVDDYYNASTTSDSWLLQKLDEYNVKTEKRGDFFKMGVIDPLKVTKTAFENAVSVATTILTTNAIITHARVKE